MLQIGMHCSTQPGVTYLACPPSSQPLLQGDSEKTMNALQGVLRRLCCPKPASGKLDVNPEIYIQWKKGGEERKQLLKVLVECDGDKAQKPVSHDSHTPKDIYTFNSPLKSLKPR